MELLEPMAKFDIDPFFALRKAPLGPTLLIQRKVMKSDNFESGEYT